MFPCLHVFKHGERLCHTALAEVLIPEHPAHEPQSGRMQHGFSVCHTSADADIEPHGHLLGDGDDIRIQRMDALQQKQFAGFPGQLPVLVDTGRGGKMIPGHPGRLASNDALQMLVQIGNVYPCRRLQIQLSRCRHFPLLRCHGGKEIVHGNSVGLHAPAIQKALQQKSCRCLSRTGLTHYRQRLAAAQAEGKLTHGLHLRRILLAERHVQVAHHQHFAGIGFVSLRHSPSPLFYSR